LLCPTEGQDFIIDSVVYNADKPMRLRARWCNTISRPSKTFLPRRSPGDAPHLISADRGGGVCDADCIDDRACHLTLERLSPSER
jgi:hypothetical protein